MNPKPDQPAPAQPLPMEIVSTPRSPLPPEGPPRSPLGAGLSKKRLALAFAIAGVSDAISIFTAFAPPMELGVDFVTALLLFLVLGWRWLLLPGLIMEAIPGVAAFPFWVLVVGAIAVWGTVRPKPN